MIEQWVQKDNLEISAFFHTMLESVTDGIVTYDRDGKIVQVNPALLQMLEVLPQELLGLHDDALIKHFCMTDEQGLLLEPTQLPSSQTLSYYIVDQPRQRDVYLKLQSGHELVVSMTSSPVLNQKKELMGCIAIVHNITEQHQKEQRIFRAFTSLLTLIDVLASLPKHEQPPLQQFLSQEEQMTPMHIAGASMTEIIAQVLTCKFVEVLVLENAEGCQHVIGVSGLSLHEEEQLRGQAERALLSNYLSADKIAQLHANQVVMLDLSWQSFETAHSDFGARYRLLTPMVIAGKLVGVFVIAKVDTGYRDVREAYSPEEIALAQGIAKLTTLVIERVRVLQAWAESRASELAMQEANSRYDIFMSMASHELRTPLTTFKGNAELALRRLGKLMKQGACDQAFLKAMEGIQQPLSYAISRTNVQERMIADLLDSSRVQQAPGLKMSMQPFDLYTLVCNIVSDVRLLVPGRRIIFRNSAQMLFLLCGDADRISQVVFNYINNALKYSPPEKAIEVYLICKSTTVVVSVQDAGPGLSLENQVKVWERYYQIPDVAIHHEAGISGLGLGLYLSREIIEQHHGQVGVDSILNEGSTFWFELPLAPINC